MRLTYVDQMNVGGDMFKLSVHYITSAYERSKIMGMDKVFVYMGQRYYKTNKAHWMTEDKLKKLVDRVDILQDILIDSIAPEVILQDTTERNWVNLYDVNSPYTLLVFWSPDCGHCKKELPKLKHYYDSALHDMGVEVFSVSTMLENKEWIEFIDKFNLDWINVSDNPEINNNATKYLREGKTTLRSLKF